MKLLGHTHELDRSSSASNNALEKKMKFKRYPVALTVWLEN